MPLLTLPPRTCSWFDSHTSRVFCTYFCVTATIYVKLVSPLLCFRVICLAVVPLLLIVKAIVVLPALVNLNHKYTNPKSEFYAALEHWLIAPFTSNSARLKSLLFLLAVADIVQDSQEEYKFHFNFICAVHFWKARVFVLNWPHIRAWCKCFAKTCRVCFGGGGFSVLKWIFPIVLKLEKSTWAHKTRMARNPKN